MLGARVAEVIVDHSGFDHGQTLEGVDLLDGVHRVEGDHDAAGDCVGSARQTGSGAARDDGRTVGDARLHNCLYLLGCARTDHGDGHLVGSPLGVVVDVARHDVGVGDQSIRIDLRAERLEECHVSTIVTAATPPHVDLLRETGNCMDILSILIVGLTSWSDELI